MKRKSVRRKIVVLSALAVITMLTTVSAQPVPEGFVISGMVSNYCNDEDVNNANVKVTNLNTSGVFTTGTAQIFWWANYRFRIPSGGVSTGNVLQFNVCDNKGNSTEFNYTVTHEDILYSGFKQDITIGVCGDENCDYGADMADALAVRNYWAYGFPLHSDWAGDVNCDGLIHMADALAIRNHWGYGYPLNCCGGCE